MYVQIPFETCFVFTLVTFPTQSHMISFNMSFQVMFTYISCITYVTFLTQVTWALFWYVSLDNIYTYMQHHIYYIFYPNLNLALWRHFPIISFLLLILFGRSRNRILYFSAVHKPQFLVLVLYDFSFSISLYFSSSLGIEYYTFLLYINHNY